MDLMDMKGKAVLVSGGTSGIGLCTARSLRDRGMTVYVISRRPFSEKGLHHVCADVSDEKQCQQAVEEILRKEEEIALLVNCAGFGISGAIEFTEQDQGPWAAGWPTVSGRWGST